MSKTTRQFREQILSTLWEKHENTEDRYWSRLFALENVSFPLAYMAANELATPTKEGDSLVDMAWVELLGALGITKDSGFESVNDLFAASPHRTPARSNARSSADEAPEGLPPLLDPDRDWLELADSLGALGDIWPDED